MKKPRYRPYHKDKPVPPLRRDFCTYSDESLHVIATTSTIPAVAEAAQKVLDSRKYPVKSRFCQIMDTRGG